MAEQNKTDHALRMKYLGVIGLLAELSPYVNKHIGEGADLYERIGEALDDATQIFPTMRVRKILERYDVSFVDVSASNAKTETGGSEHGQG